MAVIRVKRGLSRPTTSNIRNVGELAFDQRENVLYARGSAAVVKIGGELEKVFSYEGFRSSYNLVYPFDENYIYKVHVIASTNGSSNDSSDTIIYYRTASLAVLYGSSISHHINTQNTTHTKRSAVNSFIFSIEDSYVSGPVITSGITKVIDFEISPTFKSSFSDTKQWLAYGKSITSLSDQRNPSIKMTDFAHSFNGDLGALFINPGLNTGSPDCISITIYKIKRK